MEDELDPFAAVLLEGCDDLPDRLILLGVGPLLPPYHEVGGPGAERGQHDRRSENSDLLCMWRLPSLYREVCPCCRCTARMRTTSGRTDHQVILGENTRLQPRSAWGLGRVKTFGRER
jgi:hypothetical protein